MTIACEDRAAVRASRDRLLRELEELDRLGEWNAAISLDTTIENLSARLGEPTDHRFAALLQRWCTN
ncbi:hypothetical protein [Sphingopyxis sp. H115]|uniref:hypothetical protein n=1 Tax=Sphingopyxis sp. H115 TaxID=1759073 RepID=UPI000A587515|nr:hypothetical protein [Sphingopyxis sp. H115]